MLLLVLFPSMPKMTPPISDVTTGALSLHAHSDTHLLVMLLLVLSPYMPTVTPTC